VEEDSAYSQEYPQPPSQPQKTPVISKTTQRRPAVRTQVLSPPETNRSRSTQPYGSSYFLPGNILGKAVTFLLNTGCTTNLLSRRLFDTLGARERASLEPYEGAHGTLADGSCIPFCGVISLPGSVRDQTIHKTFIVSQPKEDAILGMPFLEKHQCRVDFQKSVVVMAGRELVCVDKFGRPLVGGVQVVRDCTVPGRSQVTLRCRVNCRGSTGLGVVEGTHGVIRLANSLDWLDCRQELLVQCINPFTEPVRLLAGALVGKYHSIQEADVGPALKTVADTQGNPPRTSQGSVPERMADLYDGACGNCSSSTERQVLAQLLTEYSDVFSRGDGDMGLTKVISHEIPLAFGTTPIRQPIKRLGPEK